MTEHDFSEDDVVLPRVALVIDEPSEILRYARDSCLAGVPVALITLVEVRGGAARAIGAQMAVRGDGRYCGFVSGGCTEAAVAAEAVRALRKGHDRFLRLGEGSPFFDIVLPCGGGINLSIHLLKNADPVHRVLSSLASRRPAMLRYRPESEAIEFCGEGSGSQIGWLDGTFITHYQPITRVILCGHSVELTTSAAVAKAAGYKVDQIDPAIDSSAFASKIDAFSAIALLFHDLDRELPLLQGALRPVLYRGSGKQADPREADSIAPRARLWRCRYCEDQSANRHLRQGPGCFIDSAFRCRRYCRSQESRSTSFALG